MDGFSDQLRKRTVTESQIVRANMQELKSPSEVMNVCSSVSDKLKKVTHRRTFYAAKGRKFSYNIEKTFQGIAY